MTVAAIVAPERAESQPVGGEFANSSVTGPSRAVLRVITVVLAFDSCANSRDDWRAAPIFPVSNRSRLLKDLIQKNR